MGFLDKKPDKNQDVEDSVKILATNLEVLNQKLAMASPDSGSDKDTAEIRGDIQNLGKKLDEMTNVLKSSQDNITEQLSYTMNKFQAIQNLVKQSEKNVSDTLIQSRETLKQQMSTERKAVTDTLGSTANTIIGEVAKQREEVKKVTSFSSQMRNEFHTLHKELIEKFTSIPNTVQEMQLRLDKLKTSIESMPQPSQQQAPQQSAQRATPSQEDITINVPQQLSDDISTIKDQLGGKFSDISSMIHTLLKINRELLNILKNSEEFGQQAKDLSKDMEEETPGHGNV